jgi:hypothetical protein
MKAHPDHGGTPEMFRVLVEARDRLLAALGTSAPAPKPRAYAPSGGGASASPDGVEVDADKVSRKRRRTTQSTLCRSQTHRHS